MQCIGRGDIAEIVAGYAPDAILFTPNGPLKGPSQIQSFFEMMLRDAGRPGSVFEMKHESVEGELAYIVWTAESPDNVYELGTDTFVVRDGKIVAQSFATKVSPKH